MEYLDLSKNQKLILEVIKEQIALKGYPPSVRELCLAVGLKSTSTVHSHLSKLEKCGYIKRDATKPRAIEVLNQNKYSVDYGNQYDIIQVPVIDNIVCSSSILDKRNIKEYIQLPSNLLTGDTNFILKVKGNSMINASILDGDFIIANKQYSAENNQIVVAIVHKEYVTVKKFEKDGNTITLKCENNNMDPIVLNSKDVEIVGILTGVLRVI